MCMCASVCVNACVGVRCVCVCVRACVCVFNYYILTNRETILRLVSEAKKHEKDSIMVKELQEVS